MSPTIYKVGPYRFFFNSREESRIHVHVATPDGVAKFWLEPKMDLAKNHGFSDKDLRVVQQLIEEHEDEIRSAWHRYFRR